MKSLLIQLAVFSLVVFVVCLAENVEPKVGENPALNKEVGDKNGELVRDKRFLVRRAWRNPGWGGWGGYGGYGYNSPSWYSGYGPSWNTWNNRPTVEIHTWDPPYYY